MTHFAELRHTHQNELHLHLLGRAKRLLDASPHCRGAALVGSFARGTADRVSDLDLLVYVEAGAEQHIADLLKSLCEPSQVFQQFSGVHDEHSLFTKCIFLDFTSFEFHIVSSLTKFRLRSPFVEITNKDNYLASRVTDLPPIDRPFGPVYSHGDQGLAWELLKCLKWLSRGDTATPKAYLSQLVAAIENADQPKG